MCPMQAVCGQVVIPWIAHVSNAVCSQVVIPWMPICPMQAVCGQVVIPWIAHMSNAGCVWSSGHSMDSPCVQCRLCVVKWSFLLFHIAFL